MEPQRLNYSETAPGVYNALHGVHEYLTSCGLDRKLLNPVFPRASQINGCAYCLDMHWKDPKEVGESESKLYLLNAWRESPVG